MRMDKEALWRLFLRTGLPEAYSLYRRLEERERAARKQKSA